MTTEKLRQAKELDEKLKRANRYLATLETMRECDVILHVKRTDMEVSLPDELREPILDMLINILSKGKDEIQAEFDAL